MKPFKAYVGARVELRNSSVEIRGQTVRGRRLWLIGHDMATGDELLISMRAYLKHVAEQDRRK